MKLTDSSGGIHIGDFADDLHDPALDESTIHGLMYPDGTIKWHTHEGINEWGTTTSLALRNAVRGNGTPALTELQRKLTAMAEKVNADVYDYLGGFRFVSRRVQFITSPAEMTPVDFTATSL